MDHIVAHSSVLTDEVVDLLARAGRSEKAGSVILDCTVGLGGHSEALLEAAGPDATLLGVDVDEANLLRAKERLARFVGRVRLFRGNFADVRDVLVEAGADGVDVMLADMGVASNQLDDPKRGLSFAKLGPLDMRLDDRIVRDAADLVNRLDERELADLIFQNGDERYSRRIARAIVEARCSGRIETTTQLAEVVLGAMPAPVRNARRGVHPATRTFQALRIAVNDELGCLDRLLDTLPQVLHVGGRVGIISFHSLEDGRVKRRFQLLASQGTARLLTRKPVTASVNEQERNPRSRSAKLRVLERIESS